MTMADETTLKASQAVVYGTSVRLEGDKNVPLCSTANSKGLDPGSGAYGIYDNREWAARRIALCWNACRHLSNEDLERPGAKI